MINLVLVQPEIPPNTGNIIRLSANCGARLHLVGPMGFALDHAKMRRAGLDYHEFTQLTFHPTWADFADQLPVSARLFAITTRGQRSAFDERYYSVDFNRTDHRAVAEAFGVRSWQVADPGELEAVLKKAVSHPGPSLVDVISQPLNEANAPVSEWIA